MTRAKTNPKRDGDIAAELERAKPSFTLYADDLMAPETILRWAATAREYGVATSRVRAAERAAERMNEWKLRKKRSLPPEKA